MNELPITEDEFNEAKIQDREGRLCVAVADERRIEGTLIREGYALIPLDDDESVTSFIARFRVSIGSDPTPRVIVGTTQVLAPGSGHYNSPGVETRRALVLGPAHDPKPRKPAPVPQAV